MLCKDIEFRSRTVLLRVQASVGKLWDDEVQRSRLATNDHLIFGSDVGTLCWRRSSFRFNEIIFEIMPLSAGRALGLFLSSVDCESSPAVDIVD